MKKYLLCLSILATTSLACRPEGSGEIPSKDSATNSQDQVEDSQSEAVAIYTGHPDFLNNFDLDSKDRNEFGEQTTFNNLIVIPFDESIHGNYSEFVQEDGNLYIVASDSSGQAGIGLSLTAKFKPGKNTDFSSKITDPSGVRTIQRNAILKSDIEAAYNSAKNVKRRDFYRRSDITEINNTDALTRVDRLIESIEGVKGRVPESRLDEAYAELGLNFKETGILGPGGGYYSSLKGKNYTSIEDIKTLNFSKLDLLTDDRFRLTPKELFEVENIWPWPSDHLPAVSKVNFDGTEVKVGTLNLLKKGFDDNRLQTSQGLGPQLASRFLEPVPSTRADTRPAVKPSDVKETGTLPKTRPERANWKFSEIQAKKGWDINQIRQDAQATFIEKRLRTRDVNLLGLNEVSSIQARRIVEIAKRNDFLAIVTPSKRKARDTVTGRVETDLLDNGVILVDAKKFEIIGDPKVSGYIDPKTGRPNKHITTVRLKAKGKEFYFTNTHADFGEIGSLSKHQDTLDSNLDQIIVGDMNAASRKVHQALTDPSGQLRVDYSNNTPAHVGFSKGNKGFVVDYDQVFVRTKNSQTTVRETEDIHDWFSDYATVYRDSFEAASKSSRLQTGS